MLVKFRPMLATDHIRVDWISADGTGSGAVSAHGNPSTHEVMVPIPSEVIAKGIREGGNRISVQYHFTRGSFPYESDVLDLELLPLTGLPTPTIDGVGDKVLLVLAELNDAARTRIPVWSFIAPNQRMWMIYTGIFADGSIYKEHTYTANLVTPNGVTHGIFPPTPVDKLRLLKDGSRLTIEFWVTLSESADINSAVLFGVREHTVQALPSTLPAPAFDNRPGATLTIYPLDYENTASVTVKYDGMNGEHVIRLKWLFPDGSEADIPAKNGLAGGRVDFAISQQILAASVGKTIELMYIAMINGSPVDSFEQRLTVQTIRESDLPRVLINAKANGDTLDLNTFTGNATAALAKWRLSITGQRVWITCSAPGVTPLEVLSAYDINSLEANNGLANKTVLRTWLAALPNNQEITVSCAVTFDGSTHLSKAVAFPTTNYTLSIYEPKIIHTTGWLPTPRFTILNSSGSRAYVSSFSYGQVAVIDTATHQTLHRLTYQDASDAWFIALHPNGSRLYVTDGGQKTILTYNPTTYALASIFSERYQYTSFGLAINSTGTRLYINQWSGGGVAVFDTGTEKRIGEIPVDRPMCIALDSSDNRAYVGCYTQFVVIDLPSLRVIRTFTDIREAYSVRYNTSDSFVYIPDIHNNSIAILNPTTLQIEKRIPVNGRPYDVAFSADNKKMYVTKFDKNEVGIYDIPSGTLITNVPGFNSPRGITRIKNGDFYVSNHSNNTISVLR
ncbi:hypothetical protein [Pseudomonas rhodesiae]|uniref:hypothetical protein n=1 Tax=Pseudomonas rhodesiae TaxID=76760 RepID=UPI002733F442|nr:hypothetical protein [Pseudomonas rhodesiae]WLG37184.1 hypothetical protein PSH93_14315 [Pseudomonas rhodesiae]